MQIRIYHLGLGDILWEHAYSAGMGLNGWYHGDIHDLDVTVAPTSCVAAIRWGDQIRIYYQGTMMVRLDTNVADSCLFRSKVERDQGIEKD